MQTKLTIEHLSCYLPYGLKCQFTYTGKIGTLSSIVDAYDYETVKIRLDYGDAEHIWMFNPILRPLSDLTHTDIVECLSYGIDDVVKNLQEGFVPQWKFIQLVRNRFDVFSLITTGAAISIHDLEGDIY